MAETTEEYRTRINQLKTAIENEPYIKEMRENIAEGISKTGNRQADIEVRQDILEDDFVAVQQDASSANPSGAEVAVARAGFNTLDERLTTKEQEVVAQLAQTNREKASTAYVNQLVASLSENGPYDAVTTFTALWEKYPNGAPGPILVFENNHSYIWSENDWKDFGVYQGIEVKDKSITNAKIDNTLEARIGSDIINGAELNWQSGTINNTGTHLANTARMRSVQRLRIDTATISLNDYQNYKMLIIEYDEFGNLLKYSDFLNKDYVVEYPSFVNVIIAKNDESDISQSEFQDLASRLTIYKPIINQFSGGDLYEGLKKDVVVSGGLIAAYTSPNAKSSHLKIKKGHRYRVEVKGAHNRFIVDLSKNLTIGTSVNRLVIWLGSDTESRSESYFEFYNTDHDYLLLTLSSEGTTAMPVGSFNASVHVYEDEDVEINGEKLARAKPNGIPGDYLKNKSITKEKLAFDPMPDLYTTTVVDELPPNNVAGVYNFLDYIATQYPGYLSRGETGIDLWGNEIREYVCKTPDYNTRIDPPRNQDAYSAKPKQLITTGIHGDEKTPVLGVLKLIKDLAENKGNSKLSELREAVELRIIPVINPSGYNANQRLNDNGVNLNRNFSSGWISGLENGSQAASEKETQFVESWLNNHSDALAYMDVHNTGFMTERIWLSATGGTEYEQHIKQNFFKTINSLTQHWRNDYGFPEDVNLGYTGQFDFAGAQQYGDSLGIPSCIPEIAWDVSNYTSDTGRYGPVACAMAQEFMGNFILKLSNEFLG